MKDDSNLSTTQIADHFIVRCSGDCSAKYRLNALNWYTSQILDPITGHVRIHAHRRHCLAYLSSSSTFAECCSLRQSAKPCLWRMHGATSPISGKCAGPDIFSSGRWTHERPLVGFRSLVTFVFKRRARHPDASESRQSPTFNHNKRNCEADVFVKMGAGRINGNDMRVYIG